MSRSSSLRFAATSLLAGALLFALPGSAAAAPGQPDDKQHTTRTQDQKNTLADKLQQRLGSGAAGAWIDRETGQLVVNVTSAEATRTVEAADVRPNRVDYSLNRLRQIKAELDEAGGAPGLAWGIDVSANRVVIDVPKGADGAGVEAFLDKARSYGDAVRIDQVAHAPRTMALAPGDAILTGGSRCSASVIATDGSTEYVVTAGHCTNIGRQWTTRGGQTIGTTSLSRFPGSDYGLIEIANPGQLGATNGNISQVGQPPEGSQVCKKGSTTGQTCGTITAYNQTVNYPSGTVSGLVQTTVCVQPGDSGGILFQNSTAVGITSGGSSGGCGGGFVSFFQPTQEALDAGGGLQLK